MTVLAENYKVKACTVDETCFDCPRVNPEPVDFGEILEFECYASEKAASVHVDSPVGTFLIGCEMEVRVASVCP